MATDETDDWYDSEESTRRGMIAEVQRIRRRTRVRFLPVALLATLLTVGIAYRVANKKTAVEAEIVLALSEGSLSAKHSGLPVEELREYVSNVLLPDAKLLELIERRNLYPIRKVQGNQVAIDELREQIEVSIWKNSFITYDEDAEEAEHSVRIGLTVADTDPDRAFDIARDLSSIVIGSSLAQRTQIANQLAAETVEIRGKLAEKVGRLDHEISEQQVARVTAREANKQSLAHTIDLELAELASERASSAKTLSELTSSRDSIADRISTAGLDMTVEVVEEHRADRADHGGFVFVLVVALIAVGTLLGSALILGVFDSRIHDLEDVERLGLPVLGHLPGFPGDQVGSLEARGIGRRRVPSFLRWASQR